MVFERFKERWLGLIADNLTDFGNGYFRGPEQPSCMIQPGKPPLFPETHAVMLHQNSLQLPSGKVQHSGKCLFGAILAQVILKEIVDDSKPGFFFREFFFFSMTDIVGDSAE